MISWVSSSWLRQTSSNSPLNRVIRLGSWAPAEKKEFLGQGHALEQPEKDIPGVQARLHEGFRGGPVLHDHGQVVQGLADLVGQEADGLLHHLVELVAGHELGFLSPLQAEN